MCLSSMKHGRSITIYSANYQVEHLDDKKEGGGVCSDPLDLLPPACDPISMLPMCTVYIAMPRYYIAT